jgi:hypothetical protein
VSLGGVHIDRLGLLQRPDALFKAVILKREDVSISLYTNKTKKSTTYSVLFPLYHDPQAIRQTSCEPHGPRRGVPRFIHERHVLSPKIDQVP